MIERRDSGAFPPGVRRRFRRAKQDRGHRSTQFCASIRGRHAGGSSCNAAADERGRRLYAAICPTTGDARWPPRETSPLQRAQTIPATHWLNPPPGPGAFEAPGSPCSLNGVEHQSPDRHSPHAPAQMVKANFPPAGRKTPDRASSERSEAVPGHIVECRGWIPRHQAGGLASSIRREGLGIALIRKRSRRKPRARALQPALSAGRSPEPVTYAPQAWRTRRSRREPRPATTGQGQSSGRNRLHGSPPTASSINCRRRRGEPDFS